MESYLGKIRVSSGKLLVTDPCYIPDSLGHDAEHVVEVPNGDHDVHVEINSEGGWGQRVKKLILTVARNGYGHSGRIEEREVGYVLVDSGQMSFMDASLIEQFESDKIEVIGNSNFHEEWESKCKADFAQERLTYHAACFATCNLGPGAGIVGEKLEDPVVGVTRQMAVSSSGYGDGRYPVYEVYAGDTLVGVTVDFDPPEDEDDDL